METSMFSDPFLVIAVGTAGLSVVVLAWYLLRKPPLTRGVKVALLFGIGILPIATAANGNIAGYHATKTTRFCGSCHVMTPYSDDSHDEKSASLASRHARNEAFGDENCYACHADYGMFGTVTTKIGGMRHVWLYLTEFHSMSLEESREKIHILKPFSNDACIRCHSTRSPVWNAVGDHASTLHRVRGGTLSCASDGCHGPAHPFSKPPKPDAKVGAR
jgi:nitrate/TMAO reductase-like tetraheme cytochrome c subunit